MVRTLSNFEKYDETRRPFTEEEWPYVYLKVINDPRFRVYGLTLKDVLDVTFHLKCWKKTAQELREEVPR